MTKEKQIEEMYDDIVEIFDEEYNKRNLITPQNTAEKMNAKGYRKASEVVREIFKEVEKFNRKPLPECRSVYIITEREFTELKKKYTEDGDEKVQELLRSGLC